MDTSTFQTSRELPASPSAVFAAFTDPDRLARWWGPAGFRNTFTTFDFTPGGRWEFIMHGPDGTDYPNESVFGDIEVDKKVVVDHVCQPVFRLTIDLSPRGAGTLVGWTQVFADPAVAAAVRHICVPANEQNLDRMTAEVAAGSSRGTEGL